MPDSVSVAWELVEGQSCCCGDAACGGGWAGRWTWVARCSELPAASASGGTPEEARAAMELIRRCKSEGRLPGAREMLALYTIEES